MYYQSLQENREPKCVNCSLERVDYTHKWMKEIQYDYKKIIEVIQSYFEFIFVDFQSIFQAPAMCGSTDVKLLTELFEYSVVHSWKIQNWYHFCRRSYFGNYWIFFDFSCLNYSNCTEYAITNCREYCEDCYDVNILKLIIKFWLKQSQPIFSFVNEPILIGNVNQRRQKTKVAR